jgi:hypothetical protein
VGTPLGTAISGIGLLGQVDHLVNGIVLVGLRPGESEFVVQAFKAQVRIVMLHS